MGDHFSAFSFVDRIREYTRRGPHARGFFTIPDGLNAFPSCLVAEAVGQLASWVAMDHIDFRGRPVGHLILRGRHEALPAHEPLIEARHADSLCSAYWDAFAKAESKDPTALSAFAALLGQSSQDGLVSFHLKRLLDGATGVLVALD